MNLTETARRPDGTLSVEGDEAAIGRCETAKAFEESGDFDAAAGALGPLWDGASQAPVTEGLGRRARAEVLLRAGALTGWLGSTRQLGDAQERAKNLISQSLSIFESLGVGAKRAEALVELGYCYWRQGASDEARATLGSALDLLADGGGDELRALAMLRLALVEESATRLNDALRILTEAAPLFMRSANHVPRGKFHNELATVLRDLGADTRREDYTDRALVEYAAASFHFEEAGHAAYAAAVENNLGQLFLLTGKFAESHEHLGRARRFFALRRDGLHAAQVDDTRARVFLAEGRIAEAEKSARASARALERGGEHALLAEALTTHGVALARLGRPDDARAALRRAAQVAEGAGNLEGAGLAELTLLEELHDRLAPREARQLYASADHLLARTQSRQALSRLRAAALKLVTSDADARPEAARTGAAENAPENFKRGADSAEDPWADFSFSDEIRRFEEDLIERALRDAGGSVSRAARLLGFRHHESLNWRLKNRNKSLLPARTPARRRRRSIITKHD